MNGREVVICDPVRSAVGRMGGALRDIPPERLGAAALRGLLNRTGLAADVVDEVIVGNCYPTMDAPAIGRVIALDAGLLATTAGLQLDRRCGSGLQAVIDAVSRVQDGACELVVAGGVESMSRAAFYTTDGRYGIRGGKLELHDSLARGRVSAGGRMHPVPGGMLETAKTSVESSRSLAQNRTPWRCAPTNVPYVRSPSASSPRRSFRWRCQGTVPQSPSPSTNTPARNEP